MNLSQKIYSQYGKGFTWLRVDMDDLTSRLYVFSLHHWPRNRQPRKAKHSALEWVLSTPPRHLMA